MKDLHNILGDLIDVSADMENLRTMLRITEQSAEVGEEELRAGVNIAILSLAALKKKIDKEVVNGKIKYTKNGHEKYTRIRHQKGATFATKYTT